MINKSTPILHVESVEPGVNFWTERFGFKKTIEVPEGDRRQPDSRHLRLHVDRERRLARLE